MSRRWQGSHSPPPLRPSGNATLRKGGREPTRVHPIVPETPGGGVLLCSILAACGLVDVKGATDDDRRALASIRENSLADGVQLALTTPGSQEVIRMLLSLKSEVVVGYACRRFEEAGPIGGSGDSARAAVSVVHAFRSLKATVLLLLECSVNLHNTVDWNAKILPSLRQADGLVEYFPNKSHRIGDCVEHKERVAAVRGVTGSEARLESWRKALEWREENPCESYDQHLGRLGT